MPGSLLAPKTTRTMNRMTMSSPIPGMADSLGFAAASTVLPAGLESSRENLVKPRRGAYVRAHARRLSSCAGHLRRSPASHARPTPSRTRFHAGRPAVPPVARRRARAEPGSRRPRTRSAAATRASACASPAELSRSSRSRHSRSPAADPWLDERATAAGRSRRRPCRKVKKPSELRPDAAVARQARAARSAGDVDAEAHRLPRVLQGRSARPRDHGRAGSSAQGRYRDMILGTSARRTCRRTCCTSR